MGMTFNYNISLSGLNAARYALKVTQNNVANVNTEGYARQRVNLSPQGTLLGGGVESQIGSGVIADKVQRIKDDLLIQQVRNYGTRVSYFQTMGEGMSNIESILGELGDGSITDTMQGFFNSWEELSKFPNENSYRKQVVTAGEQFAFKLNSADKDLKTFRGELDNKISVDIQNANSLIKQIADVNDEIKNTNSLEPNALLDKRDYYLEQLSRIGDVKIVSNSKDSNLVDVQLGGMTVVSGTEAQSIQGLYNQQEDKWVLAVGNVPMRLTEGSVLANLEVRNTYIPETQKKLDELSGVVIKEVNALHSSGYALDGSTGHDFFVGTNASTITVDSTIKANTDLVSISDTLGESGNAGIARKLSDLQNNGIMPSGRNPVEDWTGFVVSFGQTLNGVNDNTEVYQNVWNDLNTSKQSVQGVDIDEELAKLMQYEKFYQSNAKVLKAIDGVFESLLNMV